MATANLTDRLVDLLIPAADEIAKLDSPANVISARLRAMQRQFKPLSTTAGELARLIDVAPREVLDAVLKVGVKVFWHEGRRLNSPSELRIYLSAAEHTDAVPDLEFDLPVDQLQQFASEMDIAVERLRSQPGSEEEAEPNVGPSRTKKSPRKFMASEQVLPSHTTDQLQQTSYPHKALGMSVQSESSDIQKLLMEAAAEIAALDGTENPVFRRLMAELQSQSQQALVNTTTAASSAPKPPRKFTASESAPPPQKENEKKQTGT